LGLGLGPTPTPTPTPFINFNFLKQNIKIYNNKYFYKIQHELKL